MRRNFVRGKLIFLLLLASCQADKENFEVFNDRDIIQVNLNTLNDITPYIKQISITSFSHLTLNITDISSNVAFYIVQIHSHLHPVALSYDKYYAKRVFGTNIGLYVKPNLNNITSLYLKNDGVYSAKALLVIMNYNDKAPIPGGCNMEFDTEIAPYAKVLTRDGMITVDVQPASVPLNKTAVSMCDKNPVTHDMYQVYLPQQDLSSKTYFAYITNMLTVNDIIENGQKISTPDLFKPLRRIFNAYIGTGSVYVTVATYGTQSAAYVPAFSYACDPAEFPTSCQVLDNTYSKFMVACCFFVGLASVFLGSKCIKLDVAVPVFFTAAVISYVVTEQSLTLAWVLGLCIAVLFGICQKFMVFNLFVPMSLGFFIACFAYFTFPESLVLLHSDWMFWFLFVTAIVVVCITKKLLFFFTVGHVTCAVIGSYMLIVPFDYYAESTLKYIIFNFVRRCTVTDFKYAIIQPPIQYKDITLIVFWVLLASWRFISIFWSPTLRVPFSRPTEVTPLL
ncbi:transmembrane 7 superfamily member 3 isoform X1 [Megachile rotundata]|uniref:transmembrane 7 superfamily member 3 isoform X1 n=1 Tax=Megachile rotundata TaxID=143995 RepID=UPI003FD11040